LGMERMTVRVMDADRMGLEPIYEKCKVMGGGSCD
jgi:hypothetical protein